MIKFLKYKTLTNAEKNELQNKIEIINKKKKSCKKILKK